MSESLRVQIADLHRPATGPIAWLRRQPVLVDIIIAIVACAPILLAMIYRIGDDTWWGYALLGVVMLALMLRRRWPFAVLVVVAFACAFSPLAQPGFGFPLIPFAFALYTVASSQTVSRALLGYGVGVGATLLATIPFSLSGTAPPLVAILEPFSLIALIVGLIVKGRRDQQKRVVEQINQRIENAAMVERTRIAAEMHDVVAHALTVIVSLANGATSIRAKHPEKADAAVGQIAAVSREALADMHRTLGLLRKADSGLDEQLHRSGDNLPTLEELAESVQSAGLPVNLSVSGDRLPEDTALRQAVFRVVQESLTNALRHAHGPTRASVCIHYENGLIEITVEDDGQSQHTRALPGHGLIGIEQRAMTFGGGAQLGPRPGGGWRNAVTMETGGRMDRNV